VDSRFGSIDGVIRTTVGYTGGNKPDPSYRRMGDHTETVQVEYDPQKVSYEDLLRVFWSSHDPLSQAWSRQYRNALFYYTDEQQRLAAASRDRTAAKLGRKVNTDIEPAGTFYSAEDYHQKYSLRGDRELWAELRSRFPSDQALFDSTAAARLNGYLGGYGALSDGDLEALALTPAGVERLQRAVGRWQR
jgi:methionine-S-sulfoxide reductase